MVKVGVQTREPMQKYAENCRSIEISPKQHKLIDALIAGNSIAVSAKVASVSERTAYNWLKDPDFKTAYKNAKQFAFEETLETLKKGTSIALKTLLKHMTSEETKPYVQVQAASKWLDLSIELYKSQELEERLKELEDAIKDMQR